MVGCGRTEKEGNQKNASRSEIFGIFNALVGTDNAPDEAIAGMCAEIIDIEEWAQTAVATTRREHEMLAAILYAGATSDGGLLAQPNAARPSS